LLADNRVLIVLDNAASAEQVRPLLPGSPTCLVVITSRDRLDGLVALDAARRITLDVLLVDEAVALLRRMLGDERVAAEPDAAAELARTCACLPLALRIAAAHLAGRPGRRLADHAADLRRGPLARLQVDGDEQAAVRVTFDHSYTALKPDAQRLFRLLGLAPGPDIDTRSAAALTDQTPAQAGGLLDRLAAAHLIDEHAPGRYTFHDLLRRYARERAQDHDSDTERISAEHRLYDHYLRSANAAIDLLYPHMLRLPTAATGGDLPTAAFEDHADALAWLDAERPNLIAAIHHAHQHGPGRIAWQLADALRGYFNQRREFIDWFAIADAALTAAQADDQPSARAAAHFSLGTAHHSLNQYPQAIEHYTAALTSFAETGWLLGEAAALTNLGIIDESQGDLEQAARRHTQALALDRQAGSPDNEALALINLGAVNQYRGRLDQATGNYLQALTIAREVGARHAEGSALDYLGTVDHLQGKLDQALDHCTQALSLYHDVGARNDQAQALTHLANIHCDAGRHTAALDSANAALALSKDTRDGRAEAAARNAVAAVSHDRGAYQDAIDHYRHAQRLARDIGARYEECQALTGLAASQLRLRQPDALASAHHALALARNTGYLLLERHALTIIADIQMNTGHRPSRPAT
jgi:tetratricopeptide (TPR) repeat protein